MRGIDAADPRLVLEVALVRLAPPRRRGPPHGPARRPGRAPRAARSTAAVRVDARAAAGLRARSTSPASRAAAKRCARRGQAEPAAGAPTPRSGTAAAPVDPPPVRPTPATGHVRRDRFDLDDVIVAWAAMLAGAARSLPRPRSRRRSRIAVEGDVIVFGVARRRCDNKVKPSGSRRRPTRSGAEFTRRLGRHAEVQARATRTRSRSTVPTRVRRGRRRVPRPTPAPDRRRVAGRRAPPDDDVVDPTSSWTPNLQDRRYRSVGILEAEFGATVVEERPRDRQETAVAKPGALVTNPKQLNQMMRQVQKMQADMPAAQEALAAETVEARAGGGMVKATVTGDRRAAVGLDRARGRRPRRRRDARGPRRRRGERGDADGAGARRRSSMGGLTGGLDLGGLGGLLG